MIRQNGMEGSQQKVKQCDASPNVGLSAVENLGMIGGWLGWVGLIDPVDLPGFQHRLPPEGPMPLPVRSQSGHVGDHSRAIHLGAFVLWKQILWLRVHSTRDFCFTEWKNCKH